MKRLTTMKRYLKPTAVAVVLGLAAGPAAAVDYFLCAGAFTKTLPDLTTVSMWGYAEDDDGDLSNGCGNPVTVPGPRLVVPEGDNVLNINLLNELPEPGSIVIPGLLMPVSTGSGPTWNDGSTGPRGGDLTKKVRSFGAEAAADGGTESYSFTVDRPGTFLYHSGTQPQKQVYMGLYGAATKDAAAGEVYPGVTYANEVVLFYSDLDPAFNAAVADGTLQTAIDYHPSWFLVNGEPYVDGVTADIPATTSGTLVRLLSAASKTHVPTLQGMYMTIHAEDALQYAWEDTTAGTSGLAPRQQYSAMMPPLKTKDAILTAEAEGRYAVYDGNGYMTNPSDIEDFSVGDEVGGMLRFLDVATAVNLPPVAVDDAASTTQNTPVDIDVVANDSDPEGDVLSVVAVTDGALGTVTISDPTCCVLYTPNLDATGADTFTYTITDGNGGDATATVAVDIVAANVAPTITSTPVTEALANTLYTYLVTADDPNLSDPTPDVLTFTLDVAPAGLAIDSATGEITWTPTLFQLGVHDVTVTVTDSGSLSDSQSYQVTVLAAGDGTDGPLFFTTIANTAAIPGVDSPYNNADIYEFDGLDYSRVLAFIDTMGFQANIDGLHMVDADTFYVSFANAELIIPDVGAVQDEDVVLYDTGTWSLFFDGTTCGLDVNNGQDIDAVSIAGGTLYFSTAGGGNNNPVAGVASPYDDADIYTWSVGAASCGRALDATAEGLDFGASTDGLTLKDGTYYISFARNDGTNVPGIGLVQDEAVVSYDGVTWTLYFSGPGLDVDDGQDIDAVHVP